MGQRTKYTHGTFSWIDLSSPDQNGSKAFYSALFGWEAVDTPIGDSGTYSMMKLDGNDVAAISGQSEQQRDAGVPPMWNSYITVESADAALERARSLGATVHADAFDVLDAGRMGVVEDPRGAFFQVWEPRNHIGASLVNAPGALAWNELASPDMEASAFFYRELFGWTIESIEGMAMPYMMIKNRDGWNNGGIRGLMESEPPYWLIYLGSADVVADAERAIELGGEQLAGPIEIGPGRLSIARDAQGAVFALYSGEFED